MTRLAATLLLTAVTWLSGPAAATTPYTIGYLALDDDPRYRAHKTYANIVLRSAIQPYEGARTAIRGGRILGRKLKLKFVLERVQATDAAAMLAGLQRLFDARGTRFFLIDAPAAVIAAVAAATRGRELMLLNVSAMDDRLRGADCQAHLLHVVASRRMLADALAQYAVARKWREILLVEGPLRADKTLADGFAAAARRFGAKIVARRQFVASNDPRERERNNIALLTGGVDYDVIYAADSTIEFARYIPFRAFRPRPVIGSAGLQAAGWHWAWERHGAPQLNQRFKRISPRRMGGRDYAAWAAVRLVLEAVSRTQNAGFAEAAAYIRDPDLTFDNYKGAPGSIRPWNNQLRQPILLHSENAVIARAPIEGFLHQSNTLDTLGADRPESPCKF